MILNTSLLRERFVIHHPDKSGTEIVVAVGNRILLPLVSLNGEIKERIIIRAHSMHMTLRMAALVVKEFHTKGPLLNRQSPFSWKDAWYDVTSDFERPHTPETWCAVYNNGRPVYSDGEYHPFLDVIEQCDIKNRAEYDRAIIIAEDVFKKAGKVVSIDHDTNIALVIGVLEEKTRCGLILRASARTTTFNIQIEEKTGEDKHKLKFHDGLSMAADFLEAIQLAVTTGFTQRQINRGKVRETSPEARKAKAAINRIGRLNQSIQGIENFFDVRYRPEKPDFKSILDEAKK
jgi:hypothetical protein